MSAPTVLRRPPSVEDYTRMTQAARLTAAAIAEAHRDLVVERLAAIEAKRAALKHVIEYPERPYTPPPARALMADEYTADDVRRAAALLVRLAARQYPEPAEVKAERLAVLKAETQPKRVAA